MLQASVVLKKDKVAVEASFARVALQLRVCGKGYLDMGAL
jgi:hypothetical protein